MLAGLTMLIAGTAHAESGMTQLARGLIQEHNGPPYSWPYGVAQCRSNRDRLQVLPVLNGPWLGDTWFWTSDAATIALLAPLCRSGGVFNVVSPDGYHWQATVTPQ